MYPIKNLFTGKAIGQFAFENGQLKIDGDFPAKEEIRNLAENASQIRGERFEGGIRDEQVPLDPKTDLELVANFVNGNISDRSIQIINYDDSPEEDDNADIDTELGIKESPAKDRAFTLLKDSTEIGRGTIFGDGTCVFHAPDAAELYGCLNSLLSIHNGEAHVTSDDEPTKVTVYSGNREVGKKPVFVREYTRHLPSGNVEVQEHYRGLPSHSTEGAGGEGGGSDAPQEEKKDYKTTKKEELHLYGPDARYRDPNELVKLIRATKDRIIVLWKRKTPETDARAREKSKGERHLDMIRNAEDYNVDGTKNREPTADEIKEAERLDQEQLTLQIFRKAMGVWSWVEKYSKKNKTTDENWATRPDRANVLPHEGSKSVGETLNWLERMENAVRKTPYIDDKINPDYPISGEIEAKEEPPKYGKYGDNAFIDCPRRKALLEDSTLIGFTSPYGYLDHTAEITNTREMRGVTIADVILAREMVQTYHVTELPFWLRDQFPNKEFVKVLKSYEELDKAFSPVSEGPATQFHVEDSFPAMDAKVVLSIVKNIKPDPKCRCVRGKIYFVDKNWPEAVISSVKAGDITAVSIGGSTEFGPGGNFNGEFYDLSQKNIKFGHLAVLPGAEGRCPKGLCGVNLKDSKNLVVGIENQSNSGHVKGHFNKLNSALIAFSQPVFKIADTLETVIDIKESEELRVNTLFKTEEIKNMAPEEVQKLQDALAGKNTQIAELQKELMTFKDSASAKKVKEMEDIHAAAKDQISALQKENATLKDNATKLEERVKEADTFRHKMYDSALLGTPAYKGKEKDLSAMPLEKKAIIFEAAQQFGLVKLQDAAILSNGFNKPAEAERQALMDSRGTTRAKMPEPAVTEAK